MNQIEQFALNALQNNPRFQNNPMAQNLMQILQSGNSTEGQRMAENICKTYGLSPEEATRQAKQFFGFR